MMKNTLCGILIAIFVGAAMLAHARASLGQDGFRWDKNDESVTLYDGDKLVFTYWYAFVDHAPSVPENEARRYAGCYIHPLYGLDGETLTEDAPKDHYHHHGVFWTWPGVYVHDENGKTRRYDLWTSNTKIRQRFVKFHNVTVDKGGARLIVENGWYVEGNATTPDNVLDSSKRGEDIAENEKFYGDKIIEEVVDITVRPIEIVDGTRSRAIDLTVTLTPTNKPVSLQGAEHKSYGGLTIRFRPKGEIGVDRFITTDEGVAKEDMPEKRLRWADYTSRFGAQDDALSGAAIFLTASFPDFPPTWLTRYYGPLCLGYPGVDAQRYEPGEKIVMPTRIWIHDGLVEPERLKKVYESWAGSLSN